MPTSRPIKMPQEEIEPPPTSVYSSTARVPAPGYRPFVRNVLHLRCGCITVVPMTDTTITPEQDACIAAILTDMRESGHDADDGALVTIPLDVEAREYWDDTPQTREFVAAHPGAIVVYRDGGRDWPTGCEHVVPDDGLVLDVNGACAAI